MKNGSLFILLLIVISGCATPAVTPNVHTSVLNNQPADMEKMLAAGADVNQRDPLDNSTPLMWAAHKGSVEMVEMLVKHGADVNAKDKWAWTPLHRAAVNGNVEVVKILISHGADTKAKNDSAKTPLDCAIFGNRRPIIDLLRGDNPFPEEPRMKSKSFQLKVQ